MSLGEERMPVRTVKSSIAGVIAHIAAVAGDRVTKDQAVLMIEIMKMEIAAESPSDGIVVSIFVKPGDAIEEGQPLFSLET
jgi:biotin carboxyl carrier protein